MPPEYKQHKFDGNNLMGWHFGKLKPDFVPKVDDESQENDNLDDICC
jgi:hypothetical protein